MTSQQFSDEKENVKARVSGKHNNWFVPSLFFSELKRNWTAGLLFAVALFFTYPVAFLLDVDNSYFANAGEVHKRLAVFFSNVGFVQTIAAAAMGVFMALVFCGYLFNRQKTNFVCSLPVKRQAYFLSSAASGLTLSVLSWVPAGIILLIVSLCTPATQAETGYIMSRYLIAVLNFLPLFCYFYGLTLCACSLCGTGVMSFFLLVFFGGALPALYALLLGIFGEYISRLDTSYYLSTEVFDRLSGVFRIFARTTSHRSVGFLLFNAAIGLVYLAAAVLLVMKRKSENAAQPFVYGKFRSVVKYICMVIAALLWALIFRELGGWGWMLFGTACGAVLGWMLCNTVFFKTPKMMFNAKRGMLIALAALLLFIALAPLDLFKLNSYVPADGSVRSVTLDFTFTNGFTIRDRNLIRMFNTAARNGEAVIKEREEYAAAAPEGSFTEPISMVSLSSVNTVWKTGFPLPYAKCVYIPQDEFAVFAEALCTSDDFAQIYTADARKALAEHNDGSRLYAEVGIHGLHEKYNYYGFNGADLGKDGFTRFLDVYEEDLSAYPGNPCRQFTIATLYIQAGNHGYRFPIFASMKKTLDLLRTMDVGIPKIPTLEDIAGAWTKFTLHEDGRRREITREEFLEYLTSGKLGTVSSAMNVSPLTIIDESHFIEVRGVTGEYAEKYGYDNSYSDDFDETFYFLK